MRGVVGVGLVVLLVPVGISTHVHFQSSASFLSIYKSNQRMAVRTEVEDQMSDFRARTVCAITIFIEFAILGNDFSHHRSVSPTKRKAKGKELLFFNLAIPNLMRSLNLTSPQKEFQC